MPVSAQALIAMTGMTNMHWREMDRVSQGMIDGCSNYHGDPETVARCHDCTVSIDRHIEARMPALRANPDRSLLSVQMQAGLSQPQIHANLKLVISGGQNEPRDAIAGAAWAVLHHPQQYALIRSGAHSWMDAFEEYARWMSPIGMSPRRVTQDYEIGGSQSWLRRVPFSCLALATATPTHLPNPTCLIWAKTGPRQFLSALARIFVPGLGQRAV